jgi:rhodanese-related sulfurtransferase
MLRKISTIALGIGMALALAAPAFAYDQAMAESYAQLFAPVQGAKAGKQLHLMPPDVFVAKVRSGEPIIGLDVRTPNEAGMFTAAMPGSLAIPLHELFTTENLGRLPSDRPIVVLCKSGTRATAAGTALRHVGFDNVYILKGGFKALSAYLDAKTGNQPLGQQHAQR